MIFQEAQLRFSQIVGSVNAASSSDELLQKQQELLSLAGSLPTDREFDPIASAIREFAPKLFGQLTGAVTAAIQSCDASLKEMSNLLTQVAKAANADARALSMEQPKLIAAALAESITRLQAVEAAARAGNYQDAASQADALIVLINHVQASIRTA